MGAIKWTGKGLKLVGELISMDEFEEWAKENGKALVEGKLKDLTARWFRGAARAKEAAYKEVCSEITSEFLLSALTEELALLPDVIAAAAAKLKSDGPKCCHVSVSDVDVIAVPRRFALEWYAAHLLSKLKDSGELAKYTGLPELFLKRKARDSEASFADNATEHSTIVHARRTVILSEIGPFDWEIGPPRGHYYCAANDHWDKFKPKDVSGSAAAGLDALKRQLGGASVSEREQAAKMLRALF